MRVDDLISAGEGRGIDVALQRADDLDQASLDHIVQLVKDGKTVDAIDIASGSGGHAVRMAKVGANVIASDILDRTTDLAALAKANQVQDRVRFQVSNMLDLADLPQGQDVITCQRAIHYLPYAKGQVALTEMKKLLKDGGKIFISASGLGSELGNDYPHKDLPVTERFSKLEDAMAKHHDILQPVCLYTEVDLKAALEEAGFTVDKIYASSFGNIKAIATK